MPSPPELQSTKDTAHLTNLPSELIMRIVDLTHPSAHLNLACTCKVLAQCSSDVLRRHREAHEGHHVVSDLLPSSIPDLLRSVVWAGDRGAVLAWHVRSIEIWGTRSTWNDWRPFMLQPPDRLDPGAHPLEWSFEDGQVEEYMRLLKDELHLSEDHVAKARQELEEGDDGILKVLAIALCPHLKSLKYVWTDNGDSPDSSIPWLTTVMEKSWPKSTWAHGLRSLREVAIGVNSGTWLDRDEVHHNPYLLANLFKLPQIDSIYYHGFFDRVELEEFRDQQPRSDDPSRGLTPSCSSVRHLSLDHAEWMNYDYRTLILRAPRKLKTLAIRSNSEIDRWDDVDQIVGLVREYQNSYIESLMMYDAWGLNGYRCTLYRPDDVRLQDFFNLRHVHIDDEDLTQEAYYDGQFFNDLWNGTPEERDTAVAHVISYFPESIEVLSIGGDNVRGGAEATEECMIRLIQSGRYPNLKAIHLEDDRSRRERRWGRPSETLHFRRLVEVGERHGIDIVATSAGRRRLIHNDIKFPVSPDRYDLASGPHARGRDVGEWFVSPFTGRWTPRGCGNCGDCARCFEVYTREAWRAGGLPAETHAAEQ